MRTAPGNRLFTFLYNQLRPRHYSLFKQKFLKCSSLLLGTCRLCRKPFYGTFEVDKSKVTGHSKERKREKNNNSKTAALLSKTARQVRSPRRSSRSVREASSIVTLHTLIPRKKLRNSEERV